MVDSRTIGALVMALALVVLPGRKAMGGDSGAEDLAEMDLEALMDIEVTTVSKRSQKVSETPAAVFVIDQEDIRRSGATTVPELLRMAPGVNVSQINANSWAVSVRGFNQEFSNKLLVMIDGRTIYSPLFSGVYWNEHDLMLEDIDRIEIVRGPGGTMWGANAVNGVIHIITKRAKDTQGLSVSSLAGNRETYTGAARWGGSVGDDVNYRIYGKFAKREDFPNLNSSSDGNDAWKNVRAGGRIEWEPIENGVFTLQGDFADGRSDRTIPVALIDDQKDYTDGNVLARYAHSFSDTSDVAFQAYYSREDRESLFLGEKRDIADVDFQNSFSPFARNQIIWGAGYRFTGDSLDEASPALTLSEKRRKEDLWNVFVQDEITLVENLLSFTAGSKFEHNDYTGLEIQPSVRLLATPAERHTFWASVSRAVRTPSRVDETFTSVQQIDPTTIVTVLPGSVDTEKVIAYELGYRARPVDAVTVDLAGFYNDYDDLHSRDTVAVNVVGPVTFIDQLIGNGIRGRGYGAELAANWAVTPRLFLSGGYTFTRTEVSLKTGANDPVSIPEFENLTPQHALRIASRMNLPWGFEFDSALAWVDRLKGTGVDAYTRLDLRVGYRLNQNLEVSLVGLNLIEKHDEFPAQFVTQPTDVPRSIHGYVHWVF